MTTRPTFFEGQLLAAADLDGLIDYGRGQMERHARFVHRWGIVTGLALEFKNNDEPALRRVVVKPGIAIDGEGREVVLTEEQSLPRQLFLQIQGSSIDEDAAYPVFLRSTVRAGPMGADSGGRCQPRGAAEVEESFEISFGRLGDESIPDTQSPSPLSSTPTPSDGARVWLILLGYVRWDKASSNFKEALAEANGIAPRRVGVNASSLAGHAGSVLVHTETELKVGKPVVRLSDEDGGSLQFGLYNGPGDIEALLTVNSKGDVTAKGQLAGRLTTGAVLMQSGLATDGTVLPLPPGIEQSQVDDGSAVVHALVSPRIDPAFAPDPTLTWAGMVQECRVDAERRVHCRVVWFDLDFAATANHGQRIVGTPGVCEFLVLGSTTPTGSTP